MDNHAGTTETMGKKLQPFKRHDGVLEIAVLENFGLSKVYTNITKTAHFVENTDLDRETIHEDQYYIQIEEFNSHPKYSANEVHLLRNIRQTDKYDICEVYKIHDDQNKDNWMKDKFPAGDFQSLNQKGKLIPVEKVSDQ